MHLRRLQTESDLLQSILEDAPEYAQIVSGSAVAPDAGAELLKDLPENKNRDDKFIFAVEHQGMAIGCVDIVRDYPEAGVAFLGLLLLREEWQGRGLGSQALAQLELLVRDWRCLRIRLAVVRENTSALAFWQACGYADTQERVQYQFRNIDSELILMERRLDTLQAE